MLDYTKDGPGAFKMKTDVPPVFEKFEGQLQANNVYRDEIEKFVNELNLLGAAEISFPDRHHTFRA